MAEEDNQNTNEDFRLASGPMNRSTNAPLRDDANDDDGIDAVTPGGPTTVLRVYSRLKYPVQLPYNNDTIFIPPQGVVDLDPSLFEGDLPPGLQSQTVEV